MNLPTNTTADGTAFTVKGGERACFASMTNGRGHFPETAVIVVYQCAERDTVVPQQCDLFDELEKSK